MSAYLVGKRTIDGLITSIEGKRSYMPRNLSSMSTDDLGRLLWGENLASIEYRYPDCKKRDSYPGIIGVTRADVTGYKFERLDTPLTSVEVLRVLDTYDYQTCEHDAWQDVDNPARALFEVIKHSAIGSLPGYAEADREVDPDRKAGNTISIMSMIGK